MRDPSLTLLLFCVLLYTGITAIVGIQWSSRLLTALLIAFGGYILFTLVGQLYKFVVMSRW